MLLRVSDLEQRQFERLIKMGIRLILVNIALRNYSFASSIRADIRSYFVAIT